MRRQAPSAPPQSARLPAAFLAKLEEIARIQPLALLAIERFATDALQKTKGGE